MVPLVLTHSQMYIMIPGNCSGPLCSLLACALRSWRDVCVCVCLCVCVSVSVSVCLCLCFSGPVARSKALKTLTRADPMTTGSNTRISHAYCCQQARWHGQLMRAAWSAAEKYVCPTVPLSRRAESHLPAQRKDSCICQTEEKSLDLHNKRDAKVIWEYMGSILYIYTYTYIYIYIYDTCMDSTAPSSESEQLPAVNMILTTDDVHNIKAFDMKS